MVETMNGLKDHANSVKMQLDIARVKSLSLYVLSLSTRFFIEFVYREFY
jgi:hypothetical protein